MSSGMAARNRIEREQRIAKTILSQKPIIATPDDQKSNRFDRAHNTLFAESNEVQVFYPFHPLHGSTLQIVRRPKRGDGAVCVMDPAGRRLKIPVWMLLPECA